MLLPVVLLANITAAASATPARLVDIRTASAVDVTAAKAAPGVQWWLELGDELLLAGDASLPASIPVERTFADLPLERLAVRSIGCASRSEAAGDVIARGGRWQLRALSPGTAMPAAMDTGERWRAVAANEILARQYRLDASLAAPSDPTIQPIVDSIDTQRWFDDLSHLATWDRSSYGTTDLFAARDWIGEQFTAIGLTASTEDFTMQGISGSITRQNIIGTWTGTTHPDEWIVVGGHYDSRNENLHSTSNTPGAEDNASGCAGVIEMARALVPAHPERTFVFMCYAGEEQDLYGSYAHVDDLTSQGNLSKVKAVVVMDMIGYSADAHLDADYESYASLQTYLNRFGAAAATYAPDLHIVFQTNPWGSDHVPYLEAGVQTVLGIESDYDDYPDYHSTTDIPANIGPFAQAMGGAILKTNVAVLADMGGAHVIDDRIFVDGWDA